MSAPSEMQKQVRIAVAMGWTRCFGRCQPKGEKKPRFWRTPKGREMRSAPDYLHSLDAAAELRSVLGEEERQEYYFYLSDIVDARANDANTFHPQEAWKMIDATPEQHCEAFAKTRGLW